MTTILIILALAVLALLAFVATRPGIFRLERSIHVSAPPDRVFPFINDFNRWPAWSPWEKKDPVMKRTISGASSGQGAVYAWEGDKNVGHGRMEIAESVPHSKVSIKLDFFKPFEAHNITEFSFAARDGGTQIVWAMHGPSNFMSKAMVAFGMMEKMVGKDFEKGLADLKSAAEAKPLA